MFQKFRMGKSCTPIRQTAGSFVVGRIRPERKKNVLGHCIKHIQYFKIYVQIFVIFPNEDDT